VISRYNIIKIGKETPISHIARGSKMELDQVYRPFPGAPPAITQTKRHGNPPIILLILIETTEAS